MKSTLATLLIIFFVAIVGQLAISATQDNIVSAIQEKNGLAYAINKTQPFTGILLKKKNGEKIFEGHYKDGKQNGLFSVWYKSGIKQFEIHYKDGKLNGLYTSWYKNGIKQFEANYIKGMRDGLLTTWQENGLKNVEVEYQQGKRIPLTK